MGHVTPTLDALQTSPSTEEAATQLSTEDALQKLAKAFEMDWDTVHGQDGIAENAWPMGQTVWFSVFASIALWAVIAGAIWLI